MDGEAQRASVAWEKVTLAPVERLRSDRADSPTPGLVEGTEPGEVAFLVISIHKLMTVFFLTPSSEEIIMNLRGQMIKCKYIPPTGINASSLPLIAGAVQKSAFFVHAHSFEDLTAEAEQEAVLENSEQPEDELQGLVGEKTITEQHNKDLSPQSRFKEEDMSSEAWRSHRKHVFVLSEAGKPIYTRYGSEEALSSSMGVMMALVAFVEADKNIIRSIHAGQNITDMHFMHLLKCVSQSVAVICCLHFCVRWLQSGFPHQEASGPGGCVTNLSVRQGVAAGAAVHLLPDRESAHPHSAQSHLSAQTELRPAAPARRLRVPH